MSTLRPSRPLLMALTVVASAAAAGLLVWTDTRAEQDDGGGSEALVATSVCEAQMLKARQAEDPELEVTVPPEFASPWPTLEACLSYQRAGDPEAPGPLQPIPFSHKHHAGLYQIECLYCHSGTERARAAGVPSVEVCMGCHVQFPPAYDQEFEGIRLLKEHWEKREPIEWKQVHRLPEYVRFRHNRHVRAGLACQDCHGPVEAMDKLYLVPDTKWWPWLLPTQKLEMGWCIQCHRENGASQDCYTCHY